MDVVLFRGLCQKMNVVSEPFSSNGCFSGSTVLDLSKYAAIFMTCSLITESRIVVVPNLIYILALSD
jgi:hypothetical protein